MVDIHTHILQCVDDGSSCIEDSVAMLEKEVEQGVTDVICTPHLRNEYAVCKQKTVEEFNLLKQAVKERGIPINLYLGQEIFVTKDLEKQLETGDAWTIEHGKFLLLEFSYIVKNDIVEAVYELSRKGYKPIIAHIERYSYIDIDDIYQIKDAGGYIQVNAESIVGKTKKHYKNLIRQMFKECLVDFVASDVHHNRKLNVKDAEKYVEKKYGKEAKEAVFYRNGQKILKDIKG